MKLPLRIPGSPIKRVLPTRLFLRTLLILLVPMVVLQLSVVYVFYDRHWSSIARNMAGVTAADIELITQEYERVKAEAGTASAEARAIAMGRTLGIAVTPITEPGKVEQWRGYKDFPALYSNLKNRIPHRFMIQRLRDATDKRVRIRVEVEAGALDFTINSKRLVSSTTNIVIAWMVGSAVILMLIAALFLRNQIRPIVQLARAAEQFGLGQEVEGFRPRGASEIRRASRAFIAMADRIRKSVTSRTEMLAGISHDLRTPLTRMKLELEMGKVDEETRAALSAEIDEMRRMIDEYLDFARGDAGEPMQPVAVDALLAELAELYQRQRQNVTLGEITPETLMLRPNALRRALTNLIDNALRYGHAATLSLDENIAFVRVKVTDKGPGIPESEFENVFKPFRRLEASRNSATGGVGLGLSIARDIALSHGGDISLENQKDKSGKVTGLEVTLKLPREVVG
jgi:two-component system osmolarity sensor histidine kinase EnvZ